MDRQEFVLAALSSIGKAAPFEPVHVQKLFFLLDENLGPRVSGPHFHFSAYDYGPFDASVYRTLDALQMQGLVHVDQASAFSMRTYCLTPEGLALGTEVLKKIDLPLQGYMGQLASWVRAQSFTQLVAAIYRAYPDMKARSVFRS